MEKIKEWAKNNKGLAIVILLSLVLLIVLIIMSIQLFIGGSSSKYGNRLDGIKDVKIADDTYKGVKEEVEETGEVESIDIRLQGKIVYTTIVLKSETSTDKAKEIASATLDNYSEKELKYYDFSFFLKWNTEDGETVITGNKHHSLDEISWVKS